ncbi:spherulation-specific family 4 protein [Streptomyces sp. NPDC020742]|uniref:spherulation-specific family 4 protein n=1 Tax=unclassified Streptomyces TaxID=2593676 RepID=UPI0033F3D3D5
MSHLITPSGGTRAPTGAGPLGIGVPGFAHPLLAPAEWAGLLGCPPGLVHWAVLDVSNGPGIRPDPHCRPAAARLRETGVRVLGHLDLARGTRPLGELISEAHRYREWYKVDGFWLARPPAGRAQLPRTRQAVTALRALCDGGHFVLGHGTHPHPGYAEAADQLVTFAGRWSDYRWSQVAEWTADHPPQRFCHLVHSVPATHLEEALRIARWQGAGTVYVTDRRDRCGDAWEALPGFWDACVSRIGTCVSE